MIGIISDIHGNFPALQAVIKKLEEYKCTDVFCLGDVVGYYCMVNECIELLREKHIICLKGNHDSYILGEGRCGRSTTVNQCIEYQKKIISTENLEWLAQCEDELVNAEFCAVHGGWKNHIDEYIEDFYFEDELISKYEAKVFLSGHSHIQKIQCKDDMIYCNPGSVGQPRDGDARAAYAILNDGKIILGREKYDINFIQKEMSKAGFSEYYYKNLSVGKKIGE